LRFFLCLSAVQGLCLRPSERPGEGVLVYSVCT